MSGFWTVLELGKAEDYRQKVLLRRRQDGNNGWENGSFRQSDAAFGRR
jgi:hypothetical protein